MTVEGISPVSCSALEDTSVDGPVVGGYPALRTYGRRARSVGSTRRDRFERLAPLWTLNGESTEPIRPSQVFGNDALTVLDIGFGWGAALIELACSQDPNENVIGIEAHHPGVVSVVEGIETYQLTNVRVIEGDALHIVPRIEAGSLGGVRIWFPDPWPKRKQRGRRLVQPSFVGLLVERMADGATLHLATDIADYADQMQRVCDANDQLVGGVVPRPDWRPVTPYEQRGLDAGRSARDLVYRRSITAR